MTAIAFPLEIVVEGTPISLGSSASSRGRWSAQIRASTQARLRELSEWEWLDGRPVAVTIFYFPNADMQGDIDNIIKPILDGMKHVAYPDDGVVERVVAQRFEPGVLWEFQSQSPQMMNALGTAPPLVYIRVDDDLSWRRVS